MKTILIAEDTPEILVVLMEILESEGYIVHSASDGQAAWDFLNSCIKCPDLLITDIMMPRLNGFDLITKIRSDERFKTLPIAIYSANGLHARTAKEVGVDFLLKPFDLESVLAIVSKGVNL